jgi:phage terminase small subunit
MDIVKELMRIAFADMKDYARWSSGLVDLVPSDQLDPSKSCAISEVKETPGKFGSNVSIKLHSKIQALKMLAEHLNLFGNDSDDETVEEKAAKIRKAVGDIMSSVPTAPVEKKGKVVKLERKKEKKDG